MDYNFRQLRSRTKVNADNLSECVTASNQIVKDFDDLVKLGEKYPVEISFGGNRYLFTTERGLRNIQRVLLEKIAEHKFLMIGMSQ